MWSAAYHKQYPNIKVTPSGTGSGTGISDASDGIVDIGASDAYLSGTQVSQHPGLKNIALAISAQQINYNVPGLNRDHIKLSGQVLSDIYQGKITTWNDLAIANLNPNLDLPADKIIASTAVTPVVTRSCSAPTCQPRIPRARAKASATGPASASPPSRTPWARPATVAW